MCHFGPVKVTFSIHFLWYSNCDACVQRWSHRIKATAIAEVLHVSQISWKIRTLGDFAKARNKCVMFQATAILESVITTAKSILTWLKQFIRKEEKWTNEVDLAPQYINAKQNIICNIPSCILLRICSLCQCVEPAMYLFTWIQLDSPIFIHFLQII